MISSPNPESYLPLPFHHHKEILKIAEGLYDRMLKVGVNNTIYPHTGTQTDAIETAYVRR